MKSGIQLKPSCLFPAPVYATDELPVQNRGTNMYVRYKRLLYNISVSVSANCVLLFNTRLLLINTSEKRVYDLLLVVNLEILRHFRCINQRTN